MLLSIINININNETLLHGINFQSKHDCGPVHTFCGGNIRSNLELNLYRSVKPGYFNDWVKVMHDSGNIVNIASVAIFPDAVLGGQFEPKSDEGFNPYIYETVQTKLLLEALLDSGLNLAELIKRENHELLLPTIATNHFIPCANYLFARIIEHHVLLRTGDFEQV